MSGGREILAHWVGAQLTRADLVNAVVRAIEHRLPKDKAVSVGGVARLSAAADARRRRRWPSSKK